MTITGLLPEEIQSLHLAQEITTIYAVVVLRRIEDNFYEDHMTWLISCDKRHDVPFVEMCNTKLHEYYKTIGVHIPDIEYNDSCSSQFKCVCVRAYAALA